MSVPVLLFVFGLAFVLYVLVGYPALLWALSRRPRQRVPEPGPLPSVTVLLPVRNGAALLPAKLDTLQALDYPKALVQILVIDDGSEDDTANVARSAPGVEVLQTPPGGKAQALNAGLARARGDVLFFTDVRQPLSTGCLRALVARLDDPAIGVVSGELIIRAGETLEEATVGLYWRYEKWIRKRQSLLGAVPGATGCVFAMRRALAVPLPPGMLVDDMFLPIAAFFKGGRIVFEPAARAYDQPTDLRTEFRRKVRTLAGNFQIIGAFPRLLAPTHRLWLHFVSHKAARLALPYALALTAVSSLFLPWPWAPLIAAPQAALLLLAALDPWIGERSPLKRLSSPIRAVLVLMAAATVAGTVLLPGQRQFWTPTRARTAGPGR